MEREEVPISGPASVGSPAGVLLQGHLHYRGSRHGNSSVLDRQMSHLLLSQWVRFCANLFWSDLALAEAGDKEQLHELIVPCAYDLRATYGFCEALARAYPEQLTDIAQALVGETELLAYRIMHPKCGF